MRASRRDLLIASGLVALSGGLSAGIVLWRPAVAQNDPYQPLIARWTVTNLAAGQTFVGLGSFVYREEWNGPAQQFAGPVFLRVAESDYPVTMTVGGPVATGDANQQELVTDTELSPTETPEASALTLAQGDLIALPANTAFKVATKTGEVVRLTAVAIVPNGAPRTPGVEQVEWRAWGMVTPTPETPLVVTITDVILIAGESYLFQRDRGPALLYMEGQGEGTQPVALTLTSGRGSTLRLNDVASYQLKTPVASLATQTAIPISRERAFEARSGAFLAPGTHARLRNRALVDGSGVILVTFDGPNDVPPPSTPTSSPAPATRGTPGPTRTSRIGDGSG